MMCTSHHIPHTYIHTYIVLRCCCCSTDWLSSITAVCRLLMGRRRKNGNPIWVGNNDRSKSSHKVYYKFTVGTFILHPSSGAVLVSNWNIFRSYVDKSLCEIFKRSKPPFGVRGKSIYFSQNLFLARVLQSSTCTMKGIRLFNYFGRNCFSNDNAVSVVSILHSSAVRVGI